MTEDDADRIDRNRRHFLAVAAAATGAVGAGFVAVPFLASLKPSARAQALGAPVEVPLDSIQPGEMVRVLWRGRLVFVLRRSDAMLDSLAEGLGNLRDPNSELVDQQPDYAANETRSLRRWKTSRRGRSRAGAAVSSAPVTDPSSISPGASTRACRHPAI